MEKFQNKYRIPTNRLAGWDYGWDGAYFITICTHNREHYFGGFENTLWVPSDLGQLAEKYWNEIPQKFPFVSLGAFVVMPNHVHGILIIDHGVIPADIELLLESNSVNSNKGGFAGNKNPMLNDNISRIIRWYKGRCSYEMRKFHADFAWQTRFYDHIIRNDESYEKITNYIINNPNKWVEDRFYGTSI